MDQNHWNCCFYAKQPIYRWLPSFFLDTVMAKNPDGLNIHRFFQTSAEFRKNEYLWFLNPFTKLRYLSACSNRLCKHKISYLLNSGINPIWKIHLLCVVFTNTTERWHRCQVWSHLYISSKSCWIKITIINIFL